MNNVKTYMNFVDNLDIFEDLNITTTVCEGI